MIDVRFERAGAGDVVANGESQRCRTLRILTTTGQKVVPKHFHGIYLSPTGCPNNNWEGWR